MGENIVISPEAAEMARTTLFDWKFPGEEWARAFRWVEGVTPMTTWHTVVIMMTIYLVAVLGGQFIMKKIRPDPQKGFNLKLLFIIHNGVLSVASLALLTVLLAMLIPKFTKHGLVYMLCSKDMEYDYRLTGVYYVNYILKYIEFIDTIFLVLSKKKIIFLHVYHHAATMLLTWTQLHEYASVQWVPISINLFVHVVMYYYYMITAMGHRVWWKQWVTRIQIIQFLIDVFVVYLVMFEFYAMLFWPKWAIFNKYEYGCNGKQVGAWIGNAILSSYFVLFISFYLKTYITKHILHRDEKKGGEKEKAKGRGRAKRE